MLDLKLGLSLAKTTVLIMLIWQRGKFIYLKFTFLAESIWYNKFCILLSTSLCLPQYYIVVCKALIDNTLQCNRAYQNCPLFVNIGASGTFWNPVYIGYTFTYFLLKLTAQHFKSNLLRASINQWVSVNKCKKIPYWSRPL